MSAPILVRVIFRVDDAGMAANCDGGKVFSEFLSFDVAASPELQAFLERKTGTYEQRVIIGTEIIRPQP